MRSTYSIVSAALPAALLALSVFAAHPAQAQTREVALGGGQSVDLGPVYWVRQCQSILRSIVGVEILSGPPGVSLAVREQPVEARRQNCPGTVPGGVVVATAGPVAAAQKARIEYRVTYDTQEGRRHSTHALDLLLSP